MWCSFNFSRSYSVSVMWTWRGSIHKTKGTVLMAENTVTAVTSESWSSKLWRNKLETCISTTGLVSSTETSCEIWEAFTALKIRAKVFYVVTQRSVAVGYQSFRGSKVIRNVGIIPQHYTVSQLRRPRLDRHITHRVKIYKYMKWFLYIFWCLSLNQGPLLFSFISEFQSMRITLHNSKFQNTKLF